MADLSFAPLCLPQPFKIALLTCTSFEFWWRVFLYWIGLWKYPLRSWLLILFCWFLGKFSQCDADVITCLKQNVCSCEYCLGQIFVFKIPSVALVYFLFLGSKLHSTDSYPMMSLSSSLSWCDFTMFCVRWAWHASRPHSPAGRTSGRRNHVAYTYVQRLILLVPTLTSVAGLVGALHGEGPDTTVTTESFYLSRTILIRSGLWILGFISWQYFVCGHGVAQVDIPYHHFL